jgi:hypothetical protein
MNMANVQPSTAGKPTELPPPFEQNSKHCAVLRSVCEDDIVGLPRRLGLPIKPDIHSLVLISKNARITRPKVKIDGLDQIIKVDQVGTYISKIFDENSNPLLMAKIVASDTLENFARRLAFIHRPAFFDWHAKFGLPKFDEEASAKITVDSNKKAENRSKLICKACGIPVTHNVAKFCWFNKQKFNGDIYCMDCQKKISSSTVAS